jgi:alcohol dehydrogenase class IV
VNLDRQRGLRKFYAPEIVFGDGALQLAGRYARNLGISKALVVTDAGLLATPWPGQVMESVGEAEVNHSVYSSVTPNPRECEVMAGAEAFHREHCDGLIAVGGGSPMDCAKGIGIVVSNGRPVLEFEGVDGVPSPMPPMICVPTTSGTAADISQFAILLDSVRKRKIAIVSKAVVPDLSLLDPATLATMPTDLAACTGMDALTHAIEGYVSTGSSSLTDLHALEAIHLVRRHLLAFLREPQDEASRTGMMLASLNAGMAFSNASLGAVHAMAHSLGGLLDLPHGACNAMLLDSVVDFNFPAVPERYREIAEVFGLNTAEMSDETLRAELVAALRAFRSSAGVDRRLSDYGVTSSDLPKLAANALDDACIVTNPRVPTAADIEAIYGQAL